MKVAEPGSIRTLIVDDEPLARSNLRVLLRQDADIQLIGECGSGMEAVTVIREARPDLIFLDVQMPECDGFDVLERLGSNLAPAVVFVTAYDQYALRAFEAGALDYLLKPFDDMRFKLALRRAKEKVEYRMNRHEMPERLILKTAGEITFLELSAIDWIEAADYYSCLHVGAKTHLLRRSMAELEQSLSPELFCRIHRSTIVRLKQVRGLKLNVKGDYDVVLEGGVNLRLSRRYRKQLQARIGAALHTS